MAEFRGRRQRKPTVRFGEAGELSEEDDVGGLRHRRRRGSRSAADVRAVGKPAKGAPPAPETREEAMATKVLSEVGRELVADAVLRQADVWGVELAKSESSGSGYANVRQTACGRESFFGCVAC